MYRYYSNSKICYSYLVDVEKLAGEDWTIQFCRSSWFTRSWTLQELLAPKLVKFYDNSWKELGTKMDLCEEIAEASGIALSVFTSRFDLGEWSVAQRMSWASNRTATRVEDIAYSLLGIFDVNMPLLYGEGEKAFLRLQEEIIKRTSDHTIFGWSSYIAESQESSRDWFHISLLAPSPWAFKDDSDLTARNFDDTRAYSINNLGLEISLPVVAWAPNLLLVGLNCTRNSLDKVYIFVTETTDATHSSVRAILGGRSYHIGKRQLISSTYRRLTIATHLIRSVQNRLNDLSRDQIPYFRSISGNSLVLRLTERKIYWDRLTSHYSNDSHLFNSRRPAYSFRRIHRAARTSISSTKFGLIKFGYDIQLNPFCVISDPTYLDKEPPEWALDVDLLYTNEMELSKKDFWECTGLEETGWIMPDTSSSVPIPTNKQGVWPLKGSRDLDCKFTLRHNEVGDTCILTIKPGLDAEMRPCYLTSLR